MKCQRPTQTRSARKLSDAIIARRYLELQKLRDEVRKAEIYRGEHALKPTEISRPAPRDRIEIR